MNVLKLQRYEPQHTGVPGSRPGAQRFPGDELRRGGLVDQVADHLTTNHRKFPQFQQNDIFGLADAFRKLDVDDKGYVDEATAIKATQASERQPYDVVRQALKEVDLDSSRRVELEDYVGVRTEKGTRTGGQPPRAVVSC